MLARAGISLDVVDEPPLILVWTGAAGRAFTAQLPRDRSCAWVARRLLEEYAQDELRPREREDALLIVSELVTNAFRHGQGKIELSIEWLAGRLRLEVHDGGPPARLDVVAEAHRDAGGYGLWLVAQLASDWGVADGEKRVWAELKRGKSNRQVED